MAGQAGRDADQFHPLLSRSSIKYDFTLSTRFDYSAGKTNSLTSSQTECAKNEESKEFFLSLQRDSAAAAAAAASVGVQQRYI